MTPPRLLFLTLVACRTDEMPKASAPPPTVPEPSGSAALAAPKPPSLPADLLPPTDPHATPSLGDVSGSTTPNDKPIAQTFATEKRDPNWAPAIEEEITERTADVPAKLVTECRTEHCKLTVDGASADVMKTIALLEREDHLYGMSKQVVLSKPEQRPDGTLSLTLYVVFDDR